MLVTQSCLTLSDPMDFAHQAPLTMEFSSQEYWSVLPFPSPEDLPNPGIKTVCPTLQADSSLSELPGKPLAHLKGVSKENSLKLMFEPILV